MALSVGARMLPGVPRKVVQRSPGPSAPEPERRPTAFPGVIPPAAAAVELAEARWPPDCLGWLATWPQERFEKRERTEGRCTLGKRTRELALGSCRGRYRDPRQGIF